MSVVCGEGGGGGGGAEELECLLSSSLGVWNLQPSRYPTLLPPPPPLLQGQEVTHAGVPGGEEAQEEGEQSGGGCRAVPGEGFDGLNLH